MKRAMLPIVLMVGCAAGATLHDIVVPARAANASAVTYEYKVINLGWSNADNATEVFNRFGKEGWRIAAEAGAYVTFERQVR